MARTIEVSVRPSVLRWARETSGWSIEAIAKRVGVSPTDFSQWEHIESRIRLSHLRELARSFKRPLAAFFLAEPPKEPQPPTDFRILPGREQQFERVTRLAIRKAARLRLVAKELMEKVGRETSPKLERSSLSDDPEQVTNRERDRLGIDIREQRGWRDPWQAYRAWRNAIEKMNIIVFQVPMPVDDARGFSLSEDEPFAVVVSSVDAVHARIFTLFHEYAHLLLRRPGICLAGSEPRTNKPELALEKWCNRFAGALLVPAKNLGPIRELREIGKSREKLREWLTTMSRELKVSQYVVLLRMLHLRFITSQIFHREMNRLEADVQRGKKVGGIVSPPRRCVAENGRLFTSLVLEARGRNLITYTDVADYLSLRLKHLPKIQSELMTVAA